MEDVRRRRQMELQQRRERLAKDRQQQLAVRLDRFPSDIAPSGALAYREVASLGDWAPGTALEYAWGELVQSALAQAAVGPIGADLEAYHRELQRMNEAAIATVAAILQRTGLFACAGRGSTAAKVADVLGATAEYRPLLVRQLTTLVRAGLLDQVGDHFLSKRSSLLDAFEEDLLLRVESDCKKVLDVLTGRMHGLESFSLGLRGTQPGAGYFDAAVQAFETDSYSRYLNGIMAHLVSTLAERGRPLRILEIGGGVGATTAAILTALQGHAYEYVFSDISSGFLSFAADRFRHFPALHYVTFDMDEEPKRFGIPSAAFDVIIGANALHCARVLPKTLRALASLLVPNGILLLREGTTNHPYLITSQGLLRGATSYEDLRTLENSGPLLSPGAWRELCQEGGFTRFASFPDDGQSMAGLDERVLMASLTGNRLS